MNFSFNVLFFEEEEEEECSVTQKRFQNLKNIFTRTCVDLRAIEKHVRFQKTQGVLYIDGFYFDHTIWTLRCILNKIFTLHIKTKEGSLLTHLWGTEALILSNLLLMFDRVAFMEEAISVLKSFSMPLVSLFNEFTFDSHSPISLCVT